MTDKVRIIIERTEGDNISGRTSTTFISVDISSEELAGTLIGGFNENGYQSNKVIGAELLEGDKDD